MTELRLETDRLILRNWTDADLAPLAKINSDPSVMKYFLAPLSEDETAAMIARIQDHFRQYGWGFWAVELKETQEMIGLVGLFHADLGLKIGPFVEIGWRISPNHQGKGYAQEAANAALKAGFNQIGLKAIYAFTTFPNVNSQRVMQRLNMEKCDLEFNHPKVPKGHPLERHLLYKISKEKWQTL